MSNVVPSALLGQFPLTAPDIAVSSSPGGVAVDSDVLMTETLSELQNLQQDLGNRLVETPGSNLDFGIPNTRGVGIMRYLNSSSDRLPALAAQIDAEFIQDSRVVTSSTTVTQNPDGSYTVATEVDCVAGVFGLSWAWSQAGVVALPMTAGG